MPGGRFTFPEYEGKFRMSQAGVQRVLEGSDTATPMDGRLPEHTTGLAPPDWLQALFEDRSVGVALVNDEDTILEANLTLASFADRSPAELAGTRFCDLLHPLDRLEDRAHLGRLLTGTVDSYRIPARLVRRTAVSYVTLRVSRVERIGKAPLLVRSVVDESSGRLEDLVRFQENERKLLCHELHDGLAQDLAALAAHLHVAGEPASSRAVQLVRRMSDELERTMRNLQSPLSEGVDLPVAVAQLVSEQPLRVDLEFDEALGSVTGVPAAFVYRILQEALRNAARHGKAGRAWVRLALRQGHIHGEVRDDGSGFDPDHCAPTRGYGLTGMRQRCSLLGGRLLVDSLPGQGTTIRFDMPMV